MWEGDRKIERCEGAKEKERARASKSERGGEGGGMKEQGKQKEILPQERKRKKE